MLHCRRFSAGRRKASEFLGDFRGDTLRADVTVIANDMFDIMSAHPRSLLQLSAIIFLLYCDTVHILRVSLSL